MHVCSLLASGVSASQDISFGSCPLPLTVPQKSSKQLPQSKANEHHSAFTACLQFSKSAKRLLCMSDNLHSIADVFLGAVLISASG